MTTFTESLDARAVLALDEENTGSTEDRAAVIAARALAARERALGGAPGTAYALDIARDALSRIALGINAQLDGGDKSVTADRALVAIRRTLGGTEAVAR